MTTPPVCPQMSRSYVLLIKGYVSEQDPRYQAVFNRYRKMAHSCISRGKEAAILAMICAGLATAGVTSSRSPYRQLS